MNEFVEQLVSVVAEEAEHCERLLSLLRRQQTCLVECDTEGLEANVRDQEGAIRRSRELELRRQALLERIAALPGFAGQTPDMTRLIDTLSNDYGQRLAELRKSLSSAIERVNKTKEQNRMLIERSMFNISQVMRMLATTSASAADYATVATGDVVTAPVSVDRVG